MDVTGGNVNNSNRTGGCAAIGTSGPDYGTTQCGDIYINAAQITATSGAGAAAIGTGNTYKSYDAVLTNAHLVCGDIMIKNSILSITVMPWSDSNYYGAGIGTGFLGKVILVNGTSECAYTAIGKIKIDCLQTDEDLAAFTEDFKLGGSIGNANYKIGWGFHNCGSTTETTINCKDHTIKGFCNLDETNFFYGWTNTWEYR